MAGWGSRVSPERQGRNMRNVALILLITGALGAVGCKREAAAPIATPAITKFDEVATPEEREGLPAVQATNSPAQRRVQPADITGPKRFPALLSAEKAVIESDALSPRRISPLIESDGFGKYIDYLANQAAGDPLAQDMTVAQQRRLERQLKGQAHLRQFACGLSICAGIIDLGSNTGVAKRIVDEFLANGAQEGGGAIMDFQHDLGNGNFEQRFVMSLDPAISGILVPPLETSSAK